MKTTVSLFCATALLASFGLANAEEPAKQKQALPEFERFSSPP